MWTLYTPCVSVAISGDFCHNTAGKCTKFTCLAFELFAMNATPARRVTSPLDVYMVNCHPGWQGYPTYHVNVIKIKGEIIWKGGLPHLGRLPQLPGVPHLHVNSPLKVHLITNTSSNFKSTNFNYETAINLGTESLGAISSWRPKSSIDRLSFLELRDTVSKS